MLNPNQGYKKIVQKLKTRYKVRLKPNNNNNKVRDKQSRSDLEEDERVKPALTRSPAPAL